MICGCLQKGLSRLVVTAVGVSLLSGCSAGKLNMPNLAFWKKDERLIASHPPEQLPSNLASPDDELSRSSTKSDRLADDGLPRSNFPKSTTPLRDPYKLPEVNDDALVADRMPSTESVKPQQNTYAGMNNPSSSLNGQKLNNPYVNDSNSISPGSQMPEMKQPELPNLPSRKMAESLPQFNPDQPQFELPKMADSQPGQTMKNPYVNSKINPSFDPNGLQPKMAQTPTPQTEKIETPETNGSEFNYPDTGFGEYVPRDAPKTETAPLPKVEMPVVENAPKFELPKFNAPEPKTQVQAVNPPQHPGRQTSNTESDNESSKVRYANLPAELMNVNTNYAPGSVRKPQTTSTDQSTTTQKAPATKQLQLPQTNSTGGGAFVPERP